VGVIVFSGGRKFNNGWCRIWLGQSPNGELLMCVNTDMPDGDDTSMFELWQFSRTNALLVRVSMCRPRVHVIAVALVSYTIYGVDESTP
jgi:hypothetical protein